MKFGDISLVLCISTRLQLVTILSLLVKYLVILHADPCNWASEASPTLGCSIEISRDIYTKYSTLPSGISVYIVLKVGIFPEAGGRGKYSLPRVQYMPILHKEGF